MSDLRMSGSDLELWHVQLPGGVVRTMNLDELDSAFQSGTIDERTMILKAGAVRWTTLGDMAGIDDQPNSIAPMATDIASSNVVIPPLATPTFDVSYGTEELAIFKPKRRVGRAIAAMAVVACLGGGLFAAKSYGTAGLRGKLASVTSLVKAGSENARSAAAAPVPPTKAVEPPPAAMPLPVVAAVAAAAPTPSGVSIDSLPPASPVKGKKSEPAKKTVKVAPRAKTSKAASDPTQRGSGQFDPLNGNL